MFLKFLLSILVSKPLTGLDRAYLKRQTVACTVAGAAVLAVSIPALQYSLAQLESGALAGSSAGLVSTFGTAIMASGFYLLFRGFAHYYLLNNQNK